MLYLILNIPAECYIQSGYAVGLTVPSPSTPPYDTFVVFEVMCLKNNKSAPRFARLTCLHHLWWELKGSETFLHEVCASIWISIKCPVLFKYRRLKTDRSRAASSCAGSWWSASWWRLCPGGRWHCVAGGAVVLARRTPPTPFPCDIEPHPWTSPSCAPSSP